MDTKALRQKILELAIHGKLVPQDPNDEPASVLLQRIRAEKERLIKEGKIKKGKKSAKTSDTHHYPYELPKGWEWTTLGEIGDVVTGNTPSKDIAEFYGGNIPFFKPTDLEQGINTVTSRDHLTQLGYEQSRKLPAKSVLVTCIGATIGKAGVISIEGTCNQQINAIIPSDAILSTFLYYVCISGYAQQEIRNRASATTLPILNKNNFADIGCPLPPFAEQHRIVSEIERWFSLIDIIENGKSDLKTAVKQAKSKILDLAIHGKLVPQAPNDEPASVLLQRIRAEKERLIKEGKIKKGKKSAKTSDTPHYPYELPKGWEWCKLEEIANIGTGATPLTSCKDYYENGYIAWINSSSTKTSFIEEASNFITQKAIEETNCVVYPKGTLIIAMYGEGRTRGQVSELLIDAATNQACAAVCPYLGTTKEYLKIYFEGNYFHIRALAEGGNQPNLSLGKIQNYNIPLPPLAEQHRIVAKIEEIFHQLDMIEESL